MATPLTGIGSGLDVAGLLEKLMELERKPLATLDTREASYKSQLSAYGTLKGALSSFQTAAASLATTSRFTAVKATSGDTTVFTASADNSAVAGSYEITTTFLAKNHKLYSEAFAETATDVGSGTITVQFGTWTGGVFAANADKATKTITVAATSSSLAGVRDAINAADVGVSATVVNDGTGYRLVLISADSGAANGLKITVDDADGTDLDASGLSKIAYDAAGTAGNGKNLTQATAAQDATINIDGITVTSSSNVMTDAIEGVTLTLQPGSEGQSTTLTVARDSATIRSALQSLVTAYNSLNSTFSTLSAYDASSGKSGPLFGDSTLLTVQTGIRRVLTQALSTAGGGLTNLSEVGIEFQRDGTLALDTDVLDDVLADASKDVSTLFAAVGKPSDSLIRYGNSTSATVNGIYAVTVSQLATQGTSRSSVALGAPYTVTATVNDTLTVSVDGTAATITLPPGTYTAAQLATEIQSRLNGTTELEDAGASVTVTQSAGVLTIRSTSYGSSSTVDVSGGLAKADLFGVPIQDAGVDVAGTINGVAATGLGRLLTGASGNDSEGLSLEVLGGAAPSARGTVSFARGVAAQLDDLLDVYLETGGTVATRTEGINTSIEDLADERETLLARVEATEQRYRAQFIALDQMMARMSQLSSFLSQQLAGLQSLQE